MIVCPSCYHQTISEFLSNRFPYVGEAALDFHDRNCVDCKLRTGLHRRTADLGWCAIRQRAPFKIVECMRRSILESEMNL